MIERNFKMRRHAIGISQTELARRSGVPASTISKMENGAQRDCGTRVARLVDEELLLLEAEMNLDAKQYCIYDESTSYVVNLVNNWAYRMLVKEGS